MKLGILASHPIQYQAPLFQALSKEVDLKVYFAHRPTPKDQSKVDFGVEFEWDIDLLSGYSHIFLKNESKNPSTQSFFGCNTPDIYKHIAKEKFDAFILMGWNLFSFWQALWMCWMRKIPVYVRGDSQLATSRSAWVKGMKRIFYPWLLKLFSGFLVVGTRNREYLQNYGVVESKMIVCPHFIDNERFYRDSQMSEEDKKKKLRGYGLKEEIFTLIFVGKFIPKKRPLDLLQAMVLLKKRKVDVQLLMVGSGSLEKEIRDKIQKENLPVSLIGFVNQTELPKVYAAADLLVLPSHGGETWGLVVNEAMACGIPAIVSDQVGCAPDLIDNKTTGMVYPCGKIESLANSIERLRNELKSQKVTIQKALKNKMDYFSVRTATQGVKKVLKSFDRVLDESPLR